MDSGVYYYDARLPARAGSDGNDEVGQGKSFQHFTSRQVLASNLALRITDVVITHFHPNHIGGIFTEEGKLNLPNAPFHMHEEEWKYWHSFYSDNQPALFKYFIKKNITLLYYC